MRKHQLVYLLALTLLMSCGTKKKIGVEENIKLSVDQNKEKSSHTVTKEKRQNVVPEYKDAPWTENVSRLNRPVNGLANHHLSIWASHGRYYNNFKNEWQWQRPILYCTTEDLFTQTIVVPYLIPMLENAGATVFTPRERDWQPNEIIVDNDVFQNDNYKELSMQSHWTDGGSIGFGCSPSQIIYGSSNPFTWGTTRKAKASKTPQCLISYQPDIPEEGRYAVYVSYPPGNKNVSDAEYTVVHKGIETKFHVNQKMGAGTWVYLGTFSFEKGNSSHNRVFLTNTSKERGYVVADAVRFGGGMGNISRQGQISCLPRCLEGARYYAQWAGAPDSIYNTYSGTDDYKDDINTRSRMTNWLAGGSCFVPGVEGKNVPIELSLAVHSDAGFASDFKSIFGSLSICTTNTDGGLLADGTSRDASRQFAEILLNGLNNDLSTLYGKWNIREIYDRNYSETRQPKMPSAIIEALSHQSFPDMKIAQDPNVKFSIARSLYKSILKFISKRHNKKYTVQPLPPMNPSVTFVDEGIVEVSWEAQNDRLEPTALPQKYVVYTSVGAQDFDNGEEVKKNKIRMKLSPHTVYSFKITALNEGGESFPTETLAAVYHPEATKTILLVNGFHRLSAPCVINNDFEQGFNIDEDMGVQQGMNVGWSGQQTIFEKSSNTIVGPGGLGFGSEELVGKFIMGNTFDYTTEHAQSISPIHKYNVASSSRKVVENRYIDIKKYNCVDFILGLERYCNENTVRYKTFPVNMQNILTDYLNKGGNLLISGAYIASDMQADDERSFLSSQLHVSYNGTTTSQTLNGMGTSFDIYSSPNPYHYAAEHVDIIRPIGNAFSALLYSDGTSAAVAYKGNDSRTIALGFPFECIVSASKRRTLMKAFLQFLDK